MINSLSYAFGVLLGIVVIFAIMILAVVAMTAIGAVMGYVADFLIPDVFLKLFGIPGYQVGAVAGALGAILNISITRKT